MPLTAQEQEKLVALKSQGRNGRSVSRQSQEPRNVFERTFSRLLFPGVGQALGTAAGVATGGAAGGVGAVPGGLVGSATGAGAGEALRQFLAGMTGGRRPRSVSEALVSPVQEAAIGAAGETTGPALRAGMRGVASLGRAATVRGGQLVTSVSPEAIQRVFQRGASRVITPEFQQFAKGGVPERIQKAVIEGFEQFRLTNEQRYDQGIRALQAKFQATAVNLNGVVQGFRQRLIDGGVLTSAGTPTKAILPQVVLQKSTRSTKQLLGILTKLQRVRGGFLPTDQAIQLKRELDTLLDFDPNEVAAITQPAMAVLKSLRSSIKEAIDEVVPDLKPLNDQYHLFRELYDSIQRPLRDERIESTLRSLTRNANTYQFRILQEVSEAMPEDQRFLIQTLDFLAGKEFGQNPELFRFLPFSIAGVLRSSIGPIAGGTIGFEMGGPLFGGVGLLLGAEATGPRAFGAGLRGFERLTSPTVQTGRALEPTVSPAVSTILRMFSGGGRTD